MRWQAQTHPGGLSWGVDVHGARVTSPIAGGDGAFHGRGAYWAPGAAGGVGGWAPWDITFTGAPGLLAPGDDIFPEIWATWSTQDPDDLAMVASISVVEFYVYKADGSQYATMSLAEFTASNPGDADHTGTANMLNRNRQWDQFTQVVGTDLTEKQGDPDKGAIFTAAGGMFGFELRMGFTWNPPG